SGTIDTNAGAINMQIEAPELNNDERHPLGAVAGVQPSDTMVVENLVNGVQGCGLVTPDGRVRASLQADRGDRVRIVFYEGPVQLPEEGCHIAPGARVRGTLETLQQDFDYQGQTFHAGEAVRAIEDGLGRARSTPEIRRLQGFAQLVMDPGDP